MSGVTTGDPPAVFGSRSGLVLTAGAAATPSVSLRGPDTLIGSSRALERVRAQIGVAARSRFAFFISGEDGVDKELVARLVHARGHAPNGEFCALDVSLVPETLLARELFACVRDAIAGLPGETAGVLERVGTGTVLLEQIETLPRELQRSLARVLESGAVTRVGASESVSVAARLISSSTRSLQELAAEGAIVSELAEHLNLLDIQIPPLRERSEDVLPVAAQALASAREELELELGRPSPLSRISRDAIERLRAHTWPHNERELRAELRNSVRLARGEELCAEDLLFAAERNAEIPAFRDAKRAFERDYVTRVLQCCKGNISKAARIAKKDRKDFYDVMRRNGINPTDFR